MSSSTATRVYFAQPSAGNHQHCQSLGPVLPSSTFPSATLVNQAPAVNERPSVKLKIISGKTNIVNSVVVNAAGQSLYSISSNSKRTTVVACKDNVEVATVDWDRSSPRMVFRRKKMKCKEWLPLAGPETEYKHTPLPSPNNSESDTARSRILTHGDSQVIWMNKSSTSGCLIPGNRPGLSVARWRTRKQSDDLDLEIFQEALVESGLLEAIVVSLILLRSGRSFGDIVEMMPFYPQFGYQVPWIAG